MCSKVEPLKISPLIKAARWSFLMCGFAYGIFKFRTYSAIEARIKPLRDQAYKEKLEKEKVDNYISIIGFSVFFIITLLSPTRNFPVGARWGLLIVGVLYGSSRYNLLSKKERKRLDELERTRPEREAKAKLEKDKLTKEELEELGKQLGISV